MRQSVPVTWRDEREHRRILAQRFNDRLLDSWTEIGVYTDLSTGSPSSVTFEGVPGWATKFELLFSGVSLTGANELDGRVGDPSGVATSGYNSYATNPAGSTIITSTTDCRLMNMSASDTAHGVFKGFLADRATYLWILEWSVRRTGSNGFYTGVGEITLTDYLSSVQIKASGANTIDAGSGVLRYS